MSFRDIANGTFRSIPTRPKAKGPRNGSHLDTASRAAGDRWYINAVEVAKIFLQKIDQLIPENERANDKAKALRHAMKMDEARKILQECRNDVFESVLPMFDVGYRKTGDEVREADQHALDYLVHNIFTVMVERYRAWIPEFVNADDQTAVEQVLDRVAKFQKSKLIAELEQFVFGFRNIVAPHHAQPGMPYIRQGIEKNG